MKFWGRVNRTDMRMEQTGESDPKCLKNKILFAPSNDTGIKICHEINKYLQNDSSFEVIFFNMNKPQRENIIECYNSLSIKYDTSPLSENLGYPISHFYKKLISRSKTFFDYFVDYLKTKQPSLIVLTSDLGLQENAVISAAVFSKIPVVIIQDGIILLSAPGNNLKLLVKKIVTNISRKLGFVAGPISHEIYGANGAEYCFISGEIYIQRFKKIGIKPENIYVVGQPRYDKYYMGFPKQFVTHAQYPFKILVAFSGMPAYYKNTASLYFSEFEKLLKNLNQLYPDVTTYIKPHPRFRREEFESFLNKIDGKENMNLFSPGYDVLRVLHEIDFVISDYSTVVIEALLLGKPVILIKSFWGKHYPDIFVETGIARIIDNSDLIKESLEGYIFKDNIWQEIEKNVVLYIPRVIANPTSAAKRAYESFKDILAKREK